MASSSSILDNFRPESFEYESRDHQQALLENLFSYKQKSEFCDVLVDVEGTEFHCHKIILASSSPYFKALFVHEDSPSHLHLCDLPASGFRTILKYIYSGKIEFHSDNLIETLEVADFLQFRNLVEICSSLLLQHMTVENCLRINLVAYHHSCHGLTEEAYRYCLSHFSKVIFTDDFLDMSLKDLTGFLSSDFLHAENELDVVKGISLWCNHKIQDRKDSLDTLLKLVRFSEVGTEDLRICVHSDELLQMSSLLQTYLDQKYAAPDPDKKESSVSVCHAQPRLQEVVIVDLHENIMYFDPVQHRWYMLTSLPTVQKYAYGAAVLNNDIYITGGETGIHETVDDDVWVYSVKKNLWIEPMQIPRKNHSAAFLLNKLYVIGGKGQDTRELLNDGEVYDRNTDQWTFLPNLLDVGGLGHAALVPVNEKLYLIGGMRSDMNEQIRDISWRQYIGGQCFDPVSGTWERLAALSQAIADKDLKPCGDECLPYLGFILFIDEGPDQKSKKAKALKLYNPVTEVLEDFVSIKPIGSFGGYTMYRDDLVKTGGILDRFSALDLVHGCDLSQDCPDWVMWAPMPHRSSHHTCLTVFKDVSVPSLPYDPVEALDPSHQLCHLKITGELFFTPLKHVKVVWRGKPLSITY